MRNVFALASLSLLVACGPSRDAFGEQFATLSCEKISECGGEAALSLLGYDSVDECVTEGTTQLQDESDENSCENYNREAAAKCLDELEALSCDDLTSGNSAPSCDDVCP